MQGLSLISGRMVCSRQFLLQGKVQTESISAVTIQTEYVFLFRRAPQKAYMNRPAAKHSRKFYLSTSAALPFWDKSPSGGAQIHPSVLWVYCLSDLEQIKHWCWVKGAISKPVSKRWAKRLETDQYQSTQRVSEWYRIKVLSWGERKNI